jgi:hypothetical protein
MKRWVIRVAIGLVVAFIVVYLGDWAVFALRGSPHATVTINQYVTIPEKAPNGGSKHEYDYQGTLDEPCSVSLFSQDGQSPCWQLRRNVNQGLDM